MAKPKIQAPNTQHEVTDIKPEDSLAPRDVDLGHMLEVRPTAEEQKKVLWKLDLLLMPLMCCAYFLQFLDKFILSQTTLFGLREDLNLVGNEYAWTSAIFYFGYLAWSWPSSYLIVRLPIGKYLGSTVFIWGGILMCHAAAENYGGLMTARFFLGVGEAAVAPGFALITGMFYQREEQPLRQSAWFFGNCVAALLGGLVGYGIGHIDGSGVWRWQLMFLILGAVTSGYGLVLVAALPDSPAKAVFLSERERAIAVQRTLKNKTGVLDAGSFRWDQAFQALRDPQTWLLVLYTVSMNLANGGLTTFLSILIAGFGFSTFESLLLQMPVGGIEIIFLALVSGMSTYVRSTRIIMMGFSTACSMVGMILVWKLDPTLKAGRLFALALSSAYAINIPLSMSLITSNVAGFTKRSLTSAMIFVGYCVGNIIGPQFFLASEAPSYPTGLEAATAGLSFGLFFLICLHSYYVWENRRRDRVYGRPWETTDTGELRDELSNKTDLEIESFRYVR